MAVLNQPHYHTVMLIRKCPALLSADPKALGTTFACLVGVIRRSQGFIYAMACHDPSILLESLPVLARRCGGGRTSRGGWVGGALLESLPFLSRMANVLACTWMGGGWGGGRTAVDPFML